MIVIDFLVNIVKNYYLEVNFTRHLFISSGVFYLIYFLAFSFIFGKEEEEEEETDTSEIFGILVVGLVVAGFFGFVAGVLPLIISTVGLLYLIFIVMFKWGKNYKKLQSYKNDETSEYVKEIARLEELVKQFEKSK